MTAAMSVLQSVKKSFALSGVSEVLKCSPGALRNLLRQDHRVSLRFIASLLGKYLCSKECVMMKILDTKNNTYHVSILITNLFHADLLYILFAKIRKSSIIKEQNMIC